MYRPTADRESDWLCSQRATIAEHYRRAQVAYNEHVQRGVPAEETEANDEALPWDAPVTRTGSVELRATYLDRQAEFTQEVQGLRREMADLRQQRELLLNERNACASAECRAAVDTRLAENTKNANLNTVRREWNEQLVERYDLLARITEQKVRWFDGNRESAVQEMTRLRQLLAANRARNSFAHPVPGARVSSGFGWRPAQYNADGEQVAAAGPHRAVDLAIAGGTNVGAARDGVVVGIVNSNSNSGAGTYVTIEHGDGTRTRYLHMQVNSVPVTLGALVRAGTTIGKVGQTGSATGNHLHLELRERGDLVDPMRFINRQRYPTSVYGD